MTINVIKAIRAVSYPLTTVGSMFGKIKTKLRAGYAHNKIMDPNRNIVPRIEQSSINEA